ncbi:MAG: A24 family peptidase [Actinomycetia bacterium]|nr:A24 family peptidase [Actinomycetes bacterium]
MVINLILRIALALLVLLVLAIVSYKDAKTSEIPDALSLALLVLGVVALIVVPEISLRDRMVGLVAVACPLLLVSLIRKGSIGGGDIKLMAAAGFLLGWQSVLLAAAVGILGAAAYAIALIVRKQAKGDHKFPFGPFLCVGIAVAYFFGGNLIAMLFG